MKQNNSSPWKIIDARTEPWGVDVISVEIRDVLIPQALEDAMSICGGAASSPGAQLASPIALSFFNRSDAGRQLADALHRHLLEDPIVVGISRGGVPVANSQVLAALRSEVDGVLCLVADPMVVAIGARYSDFSPVSEAEVVATLADARRRDKARSLRAPAL